MTFAPNSFADRKILVAGASSGLGRAAALALAAAGAKLILLGRNENRLREVADAAGGQAWRSVDLADDNAADAVIREVAADAPIDGIFHSAGTSLVAPMRMTKTAQINDLFGAAVYGALGVARAASRRGVMRDGGSLVFMSSVSSLRGRRGMVAYSSAKAATSGLVRALAVELADRGIRVNSIAAGAIETEMHHDFASAVSEEMVANYRNLHPLGFGRADDVAQAVMFLLSDASRWITGVDLSVDGGYAAK
ncbi:MAG: SDR family oxidoreductase [Sphingomonadales bacterium]|nr:SDR family oxidoreductase [Sphingomonadales bacterium]